MPGHSRSKNGVAWLAYVPGIYVCRDGERKDKDHAALRLARKSPMRSSAFRMFSVELA